MSESAMSSNTASPASGDATSGGGPSSGMIQVTEKALNEIRRIQTTDPTAVGANLRVMVTGGGCSGMSYKLGFDNQPAGATDKVFENENYRTRNSPAPFVYVEIFGTFYDQVSIGAEPVRANR